jgi:tetratricopeptide (TPR) repeat protein
MAQPETTDEVLARGRAAFEKGAYAAALLDLEEVARRRPRFADVQHMIGVCLSLTGRPEAALGAFDRALAVNPAYVEAHVNRAIVLNGLGRTEEAAASFALASEYDRGATGGRFSAALSAELANRHAALGDLYAQAGALEEAVEQYTRAREIRPRFLDIRNRLARVRIELRDLERATRELREILALHPGFTDARVNLGLALYRGGALDAACAEWEQCLRERPGDAQVESYLGMLRRQREVTNR